MSPCYRLTTITHVSNAKLVESERIDIDNDQFDRRAISGQRSLIWINRLTIHGAHSGMSTVVGSTSERNTF
jgi:hypothetical protein